MTKITFCRGRASCESTGLKNPEQDSLEMRRGRQYSVRKTWVITERLNHRKELATSRAVDGNLMARLLLRNAVVI